MKQNGLTEEESENLYPNLRCVYRTDIHGRCILHKGHRGRHTNALGDSFSVVADDWRTLTPADTPRPKHSWPGAVVGDLEESESEPITPEDTQEPTARHKFADLVAETMSPEAQARAKARTERLAAEHAHP